MSTYELSVRSGRPSGWITVRTARWSAVVVKDRSVSWAAPESTATEGACAMRTERT